MAPSGLSLYANLLDGANRGSKSDITSDTPSSFDQDHRSQEQQKAPGLDKQQISSATLRFQPTKRPQISSQKPKPKSVAHRQQYTPSQTAGLPTSDTGVHEASLPSSAPSSRPPAKTTLADWTAEDGDDDAAGLYGGEKRQRGGRKRRKKTRPDTRVPQNWDDIYDPSRPNVYEDYKNSDERLLDIREWKDRLYAHRRARRRSSDSDSDDQGRIPPMNNLFAPPSDPSFAPPPISHPAPSAPVPATIQDDATGDDAYLKRMQTSGTDIALKSPSPGQNLDALTSLPQLSPQPRSSKDPPPHQAEALPQPVQTRTNISRAPVRYAFPAPPSNLPPPPAKGERDLDLEDKGLDAGEGENEIPRSLRPGQKDFAKRFMSKHGWSKGSGLGANGSGITAPLQVQVEKQKKRPDSEGGGFVGPGGMGKIVGGKRTARDTQEGKFGPMSEVIVLEGMLKGMDLDLEMEAQNGGLIQEIGDECGNKYGRVERVFISRGGANQNRVYVKFTSQLSALRAVNALEGRIFNGNTIVAKFFDSEKFQSDDYE